ncbi:MAG TPA: ATP-binding cassette domain-containing protein, partial [Bacillota bacterium]|nr:ATP-binding cassette domain-containing protein [Bacillota bacterium]
MNILSAEKISKSFGMKTLFTDLTFGIGSGEKIGLIGVNGTGKSTLIKILVGREQPESGLITKANQARIGYLSQTPSFAVGSTVLDAVIQGSSPELRLIHEYEQILQATEDEPTNETLQKKLLQLTEKMDRFQAWGIEHEAKNILTKLG